LIVLLLCLAVLTGIIFNETLTGKDRLRVRLVTLSDYRIAPALDGLRIAVISDLHYNTVNHDRVLKALNKLAELNPDVVIFLGDVLDSEDLLGEAEIGELVSALSEVPAPYGKFAVLGDEDLLNVSIETLASQTLTKGGFEVLSNTSIKLTKGSSSYIRLVALESQGGGFPDAVSAFAGANENEYIIVLCHTPDSLENIYGYPIDYMLSGHTLGGQVNIPLIGSLRSIEYGQTYNTGIYRLEGMVLDINGGIGTMGMDLRFFSPAEIVIYQLKAQ